jgi:dTDP-4-amino-4,6-dideoxy-D-glucose acyltransferase
MKYKHQFNAFQKYLVGESFSIRELINLAFDLPFAFIEGLIRNIPGPIGILVRRAYFKRRLASLGKNTIIDVGVYFFGPKNISIGSFTWIDSGVRLEALLGEIKIGSRVHLAPYTIIGARSAVIIEDYAGISAGVKIYSGSESPVQGKHMSGPMVPEYQKAFTSKPIRIGRDSFVGANSVLIPGANLETGAVLGALSFLNKSIPSWEIWIGSPAKKISSREPFELTKNEPTT